MPEQRLLQFLQFLEQHWIYALIPPRRENQSELVLISRQEFDVDYSVSMSSLPGEHEEDWLDTSNWFLLPPLPPPILPPESLRVLGDRESLVPQETVEALVDLAKQDQPEEFRWLARSAGVAEDQVLDLWEGVRKRTTRPKEET